MLEKPIVGSKTNETAPGKDNILILVEPPDCLEASEILDLIDQQVTDTQSSERQRYEEHIHICQACKVAYKTFVYAQKLSAEVEMLATVATLEDRKARYLLPVCNSGNHINRRPRRKAKA